MSKKKAAKRARILIVDDHPAVREALRPPHRPATRSGSLRRGHDTTDALRLLAESEPDVAVVDISLKSGNGIDLIKRIKDRNAQIRIVVWSMHGESLYAERLSGRAPWATSTSMRPRTRLWKRFAGFWKGRSG